MNRSPFPKKDSTQGLLQVPHRSLGSLGLTIIELLTVISVIVLLISLGIPAVNSLSDGRALSNALDRALSMASNARQVAISKQIPVALLLTNNRQAVDTGKLDALIALEAKVTQDANGVVTWKWVPSGTWQKLFQGVQILDREQGADPHSFYDSSTQATSSGYSQLGTFLPSLEGESIGAYLFVVFRPDGSVDAPQNNPFLEFKRLRTKVVSNEAALILSRESGRARIVRYN